MPKQPLESLGVLVREKRAKKKLREAALEIGISPATLMRVENGRIPDVATFGRICQWLGTDPGSFLGFEPADQSVDDLNGNISSISAHFRSDKVPDAETVKALAQMVLFTLRAQPRFPNSDK
jgi:transcriptional regulator with XRE-family HTH domain